MDKDAEALLLLTNRLLMDFLSVQVSTGVYKREGVTKLIDFSAQEVVRGSPHLQNQVGFFAELLKERLADEPEG